MKGLTVTHPGQSFTFSSVFSVSTFRTLRCLSAHRMRTLRGGTFESIRSTCASTKLAPHDLNSCVHRVTSSCTWNKHRRPSDECSTDAIGRLRLCVHALSCNRTIVYAITNYLHGQGKRKWRHDVLVGRPLKSVTTNRCDQ